MYQAACPVSCTIMARFGYDGVCGSALRAVRVPALLRAAIVLMDGYSELGLAGRFGIYPFCHGLGRDALGDCGGLAGDFGDGGDFAEGAAS